MRVPPGREGTALASWLSDDHTESEVRRVRASEQPLLHMGLRAHGQQWLGSDPSGRWCSGIVLALLALRTRAQTTHCAFAVAFGRAFDRCDAPACEKCTLNAATATQHSSEAPRTLGRFWKNPENQPSDAYRRSQLPEPRFFSLASAAAQVQEKQPCSAQVPQDSAT